MSTYVHDVDVAVVGSGAAGSTAAIAAARTGAHTLLLERHGFLGGTSTAVLDTFYAFFTPGERPRKVVSGIPDEVVAALRAEGACFERPNTYGAGTGITYDPETLKRVWERLVVDAGAAVLLHAVVHGVELDRDRRVSALRVWTRGGERRVRAQVVVDASGDADVCSLAGAATENAAAQGVAQSLSTVFRLANVDVVRAESVPKRELWGLMAEAAASGRYALPRLEGSWHRTPHEGVVMCLMTRVRDVDATDPEQLTAAELEGRRQCAEYARFLRERVPGFERAALVSTSPAIGIRESRRIVGDYVLTAGDVLAARSFPDQVARCGAPIEEHHAGTDTRWVYLEPGATYGIPWRSLLPRDVEGVVVAGRCLSATHDAHASARSMATCMAMGQAAGTGAALAVAGGCVPRRLDPARLRERLRADGADVGA
ncbi:MAG TPA: FAD-dependent oxidoreductase [Gaiellaceae bacterium]|nr:FAD-dependent oxidoreductase [Gaiellaceae bacterium]